MATVKQNRLATLDKDLLDIQHCADNMDFNIDSLKEWQELNAIVVEYHMGERKYSKKLITEYGIARYKVVTILGGIIV